MKTADCVLVLSMLLMVLCTSAAPRQATTSRPQLTPMIGPSPAHDVNNMTGPSRAYHVNTTGPSRAHQDIMTALRSIATQLRSVESEVSELGEGGRAMQGELQNLNHGQGLLNNAERRLEGDVADVKRRQREMLEQVISNTSSMIKEVESENYAISDETIFNLAIILAASGAYPGKFVGLGYGQGRSTCRDADQNTFPICMDWCFQKSQADERMNGVWYSMDPTGCCCNHHDNGHYHDSNVIHYRFSELNMTDTNVN